MPTLRRLAVTAALLVCALAAPAGAVGVAPGLDSSTPRERSRTAEAPQLVQMSFDRPVQTYYPVVVTGPTGGVWSVGEPRFDGGVLQQQVQPLGPAGTYTVRYRVDDVESVPLVGSWTFELTEPGPGGDRPALAAQVDATMPYAVSGGSGARTVFVALGASGALLALLLAAAVRRSSRTDDAAAAA